VLPPTKQQKMNYEKHVKIRWLERTGKSISGSNIKKIQSQIVKYGNMLMVDTTVHPDRNIYDIFIFDQIHRVVFDEKSKLLITTYGEYEDAGITVNERQYRIPKGESM